jgi:hypothetical protein
MFEDLNRFARNDWSIRLDGRANPNTGIDRASLRGLSPWNDPVPMSFSAMSEKSQSIGMAQSNARNVIAAESRSAFVRAAIARASLVGASVAVLGLFAEESYRRGLWDTFTSWDTDPLTFEELIFPSAPNKVLDDLPGSEFSPLINLDLGANHFKGGGLGDTPSGHRYIYATGLLPVAFYRRFHGSQPESGPTGSETPSWS